MIRRSFRIGLALGLLGGLAFALAKMLGARPHPALDAAPASTEPWPRLREEPPSVVQPAPVPVPEPVLPAVSEPAPAEIAPTVVDEVVEEAAARAAAEPAPVKPAPAQQAATKVTPAAKPAAKKAPAKKATAKKKAPAALWVEPSGDVCPTSHPVKAKLSSKIFHLPGMLNYERTKPDRCYRDAPAAESDGLRPAKR